MIKYNQNGKDEWFPSGWVLDLKIKEMRTLRRERYKFLQEDRDEHAKM